MARCMSPASKPGGRAIPAIGARLGGPALRYKMSQRRNPLILPSKRSNLARSPLQEVITAQPVLARGVGRDRNCAWI